MTDTDDLNRRLSVPLEMLLENFETDIPAILKVRASNACQAEGMIYAGDAIAKTWREFSIQTPNLGPKLSGLARDALTELGLRFGQTPLATWERGNIRLNPVTTEELERLKAETRRPTESNIINADLEIVDGQIKIWPRLASGQYGLLAAAHKLVLAVDTADRPALSSNVHWKPLRS